MARAVFGMHGAGGNGSLVQGFGSYGDQPMGVDFYTLGGYDYGTQVTYRTPAGATGSIGSLPGNNGWNDATSTAAYITAARAALESTLGITIDELCIHGFSYGGGGVQRLASANYSDGGRVKGFVCDDPVDSGTYPPVGWSNKIAFWYCIGGPLPDTPNVASRWGVTARGNPWGNGVHRPMTTVFGVGPNYEGNLSPPEFAVNGATVNGVFVASFWGGGTPPPPPPVGDQTTYEAENAAVFNQAADGARVSADSPGYQGSGYIGWWWQLGEGVRFSNVQGGTEASNRTLRFRYRSAEAAGATRRLRVNGTDRGVVTFTKNANAWTDSTWTEVVVQGIPLIAGNNTIELTIETPGGVDLDYMMVDVVGGTTPPPPTGGATPPRVIAGEQIFPADSVFYADVSALPLLSGGSTRLLGHLEDPTYRPEWGSAGYFDQVTCDFGSGQWDGRPFGFPLTIVEATQATTRMNDVTYASESDIQPNQYWPVPIDALREHVVGDDHVTVLQKGTHRLYEAWNAVPLGDGSWHTGSNALWDLTGYKPRPVAGWTSADASGLPVLPLSVSDDEVLDVGEINHAMRICVAYPSSEYIWPANHIADMTVGVRSDRLRMGDWIRLKASVDPAARGLGPQAQILAAGLKKHGAIVIDVGPFLKINGLYGPRWNNSDLNTVRGLHAADFEVVDVSSIRVTTSDRNIWFKITQNTGTTPPPVGTPIAITGRTNTYAVKAENTAFRTAAANALLAECQAGWDGVLITDAFTEPGQGLEQNTAYNTAAEVQAITQGALTQIMTAVRNAGYIAIASADDIADYNASDLSDTWEAIGTGVEEPEFIRDAGGTLKTTAVQQAENVPHSSASGSDLYGHFNINRTVWASKDAAIHALATYLCFTDGAAILELAADTGYNDAPPYTDEFLFNYGNETAARTQPFTGVYLRKFVNGAAVTNLSGTSRVVTLGGTYYDWASPTGMTSVTVAANSGVVLRTTPVATTPPPDPGGTTGTVQAETGTLSDSLGHAVSTASPGYLGTGYIGGWWQSGEKVTLTINVSAADDYNLIWRYRCAEPDGAASRSISVNGGAAFTVSFPTNTSAWTDNAWATATRTQVPLNAGNNTIVMTCPSSSGNGLDLDQMQWEPYDPDTEPPPDPGTGTGNFEFSNNELRDPEGRRLVLLGANGSFQHFNDGTVGFIQNMPVTQPPLPGGIRSTMTGRSADVQAWGWNFIRLTTVPDATGVGGLSAVLPKMLAIIDEYTAKKICVTFCHLMTQDGTFNPDISHYRVQQALDMWEAILAARPNNPYIWIDCGGEVSKDTDSSYWTSYYTNFYNAIRAMTGGANNMVMCTAIDNGQGARYVTPSIWNSFVSGKHHICLDWHAYSAGQTAAQNQTTLNTIRSAAIPLVIMEHGYPATPASGPPAGFNPGACCGATYANQRATCLQIIDTWVPTTHVNAVWWIATGDDGAACQHSLRYNGGVNGTYQDWNMPFSEYGQKMWNVGQTSRFY